MISPFYIPLCGDAVAELAKLSAQSVQCCITSPPYYGLRDYGVAGQIGLEETPEKYVDRLVAVFMGVWRVLRDDGTLWIVIGDSYAGGSGGNYSKSYKQTAHGEHITNVRNRGAWCTAAAVKPKDLLGIPWLLAFALRSADWYLRQEIIWAKSIGGPVYRGGSCMPESVTDRCTRSHETIFMFSKSERYFYDIGAIKEPTTRGAAGSRFDKGKTAHRGTQEGPRESDDAPTRNMRSVWHVNPKPFKEAHFATFPPELIAPMILAGTSERGCCSICGAPYVRIVERQKQPDRPGRVQERDGDSIEAAHGADGRAGSRCTTVSVTLGWAASCSCGAAVVPCVVLDPFSGVGTTALVALQHGRSAISIELKPEYVDMARQRLCDAGVL